MSGPFHTPAHKQSPLKADFKLTPVAATITALCQHWKILGKASPYDNLLSLPQSKDPKPNSNSSEHG